MIVVADMAQVAYILTSTVERQDFGDKREELS